MHLYTATYNSRNNSLLHEFDFCHYCMELPVNLSVIVSVLGFGHNPPLPHVHHLIRKLSNIYREIFYIVYSELARLLFSTNLQIINAQLLNSVSSVLMVINMNNYLNLYSNPWLCYRLLLDV